MPTAKGSNPRKVVARGRKELQAKDQLDLGATIDVLPDDVLLEVFSFYLGGHHHVLDDTWHKLVQVCRRWREVVFASPYRLNLRLLCTNRTPVKKLLDILPALPIVIHGYGTRLGLRGFSNLDAALEHNDRICEITLDPVSSPLLDSMKEPFPALTSLKLSSCEPVLTLPDSFLGGSAPRLRRIAFSGILSPRLPKLLLSAPHLVHLRLWDYGYIPPEEVVTCLSSLTNLKVFALGFRSQSRPDQPDRHQPLLTRTVLPSLTSLWFKGVDEYLDDIMALVDIPLLDYLNIIFFNQITFHTPQLRSFINRTEAFMALHRAKILFSCGLIEVTLVRECGAPNGVLRLGTSCDPLAWDRQHLSMACACSSSLPLLPTLEHLYISGHFGGFRSQDGMGDSQWRELLRPFITVKSLYLDGRLVRRVALALEQLAKERGTEVLPALQNIFVQGLIRHDITQSIAARQFLGHSVAVQDWDGKWL